jgi:hypothetical protein
MTRINTPRELFEAIAHGDFSSVGGYTLVLYTHGGDSMHPSCARKEAFSEARKVRDREHDRVAFHDVYWEGPAMECVHCSEPIESAYGDPDESEGS